VIDVPFAYAFTAGMVAVVNPCGFPMLPAYVSYFIGLDDDRVDPGWSRVPRALLAAAAVSAGFLAVFVGLGVPIRAGVTSIYRVMPWLTIVIGVVLVALGVALLSGYRLKVALPRLDKGGRSRRAGSMVLFGVSYAIASLGCTLPLFLPVVANRSNAASGVLAFVAYGLGMGVVLTALSVALALARESMVRRMRSVLRYVDRVAGALLVLVGLYLVWYWSSNLATDPSVQVGSSPIDAVESWSAWASTELSEGGAGLGLTLALAVAAAAGWLAVRRRRRQPVRSR
jgi:cytochrome c biogenesis protein CcdA